MASWSLSLSVGTKTSPQIILQGCGRPGPKNLHAIDVVGKTLRKPNHHLVLLRTLPYPDKTSKAGQDVHVVACAKQTVRTAASQVYSVKRARIDTLVLVKPQRQLARCDTPHVGLLVRKRKQVTVVRLDARQRGPTASSLRSSSFSKCKLAGVGLLPQTRTPIAVSLQ